MVHCFDEDLAMSNPEMESVVILSLGNLSRRLTLGQGMYPLCSQVLHLL